MKEANRKVFASIELGLGIILILIAVTSFILSVDNLVGIAFLFYGVGSLLWGLAFKSIERSQKNRIFLNLASLFFIIGSTIEIYYLYFSLMKMGVAPPKDDNLYWITLASDIFSNTLYFGSISLGDEKNAYRNGALLGLAAGVGAVVLPAPLGLGNDTTARTGQTELMTVAWYLAGGLAAAAVYQLFRTNRKTELKLSTKIREENTKKIII